jgi:hypothetical protein
MAENTNVFKSSMKTLKEKIGNTEINAQTIITILRFSMEVVEATQLKGEAQKELAIKLVRQVVVEAPISDEKEQLLIDAGILADTVELVVDATKGEVDVNAAVKVAAGCCASFLHF